MTDKEIRELIKQTDCPFLAARKGYWIGADSPKEIFMMGKDFYRENAYKYLKNQEYHIKRGLFLSEVRYDRKNEKQIVDWASDAYDRKIKELEEAIGN